MDVTTTTRKPAARPLETLAGETVEVWRRGSGRPILLLHGVHDIDPDAPFVDALAAFGEVIAPTHPGFGATQLPAHFTSMYDLVHHYRGVMEEIAGDAVVVGFSFGGWIAAELAASGASMQNLVLVDSLGIRFGGDNGRENAHLFNTHPAELQRLAWSDPTARPRGCLGVGWPLALDEVSDAELLRLHASNDALSLYGWKPHMHNPALRNWLHRIKVPTLLVWGADDGIVPVAHGRRLRDAIPGAELEVIAGAGHHPELEKPREFVAALSSFLAGERSRA